jgi:hypothetical protein
MFVFKELNLYTNKWNFDRVGHCTFLAIYRKLHKLRKRQLRFFEHILNQEQPVGVGVTETLYYIIRHRPFGQFYSKF